MGDSSGSSTLSMAFSICTNILKVFAGIILIGGGVLYVKQESLLYFPAIGDLSKEPSGNPKGYRSPSERNLPFESHRIPTSDGIFIHSWLILAQDPKAPTIVFFHGNAGNIGLRLPNAKRMFNHLHANILLVDYRGFGESDSVPSEAGLKLDAQAALHYCHDKLSVDKSKIFVFGRSLGGAVAFDLAAYAQRTNTPLAGVIVENTFTSISDMVDVLMPMLTPIKRFVLRIGWKSIDLVPALRIPTLYLAGSRDELVPHGQMLQLYQAQKKRDGRNVQLHVIQGGTHNESWMQGGIEYWDVIRDFMELIMGNTMDAARPGEECDVAEGSSIPIMANNLIDMASRQQGGFANKKID